MKNIFIALFIVLTPFQIMAAEPLKVTYGLYASGFNVVDIEGTYDINEDTYDLTMDLKTRGMLGKLAPWSGVIKSNGLNKGEQSTPLAHSFSSTWRDDLETTAFAFGKDGALKSTKITKNGTTKEQMPPSDVYKDKPIDMLSAVFRVMNNPTCETTQAGFDKKRRFDMSFKSKGTDVLEQSKYSVFSGEAEICEIEIIPVAGKWRDKKRGWMSIQDQAKGNGQLPRLWFGKVRDDMPPIPVRFLIKTNYGVMVMHLKEIKI